MRDSVLDVTDLTFFNLGHRIAHQDHSIIAFEAASNCGRDADARGHPGDDAHRHTQISEDRIQGRIREAPKPFLAIKCSPS